MQPLLVKVASGSQDGGHFISKIFQNEEQSSLKADTVLFRGVRAVDVEIIFFGANMFHDPLGPSRRLQTDPYTHRPKIAPVNTVKHLCMFGIERDLPHNISDVECSCHDRKHDFKIAATRMDLGIADGSNFIISAKFSADKRSVCKFLYFNEHRVSWCTA